MPDYPKGKRKRVITPKTRSRIKKIKDPNSFVLGMLINSAPYYVSGSILADKLNMSRVGVWSRIDKLRRAGLTIEASQNLGYRLAGEPNDFNLPLMNAWMKESRISCKIFTNDQIDSTNSEVERLLANEEKSPFVVLANQQLKGRGRLGRSWHSPKGGNIYLSMGFRPNVQVVQIRNFTLWQGIHICKLLRDHVGTDKIKVKWPNDLYYEGKKLAGMLTEASIDCESIKTLVFGLGLNVNISSKKYPDGLAQDSVSLENIAGGQVRLHELSAKIIKTILNCFDKTINATDGNELIKEWKDVDELNGKRIQVICGNDHFIGKSSGINTDGNLLLKLRNGRIKNIHSGEIKIL
jgi:BirA family biotin operon repressor/biotin-[acetyl-CoA-carboxylase] ligase